MKVDSTRYCVAVYWPNDEGYGGITKFASEAEALAAVKPLHDLNFREVHVWEERTRFIKKSVKEKAKLKGDA